MRVSKNFSLKKFTTMAIGGPAEFFLVVKSEDKLRGAIQFATQRKLPWYVVGEGSNLIVNDTGYKGVIIKMQITNFKLQSNTLTVGAGNNLLKTVRALNRAGIAGIERMAGIPGTVGGAIYGCAGAYGQEIKDYLISVKIWDGRKKKNLTRAQCEFGYRDSIFKRRKNWIILSAIFKLKKGDRRKLEKISRQTIKLRAQKYKPGLKCPGSFFKNIKLSDLHPVLSRKKFEKNIDSDKIMYGKVPVGYLLEEIGAKGMSSGRIRVAAHHANLIYNPGGGNAKDVKLLARKLKNLVQRRFHILIEEEVQYL